MAKDKDKKPAEEGDEQQPKKSKMGLILIIVGVLVGVGIGYFLSNMLAGDGSPEIVEEVVIPDSLDGLPNYEEVVLEGIAVNALSQKRKARAAVLATTLVCEIKPLIIGAEEFETKKNKMKDLVKTYLRAKSIEFLKDPKSEKIIKKELMRKMNRKLEDSEIIKIYFTSYIIQGLK